MRTKVPSRNQLIDMQNRIEGSFGDVDEYHFYAIGKSSKFADTPQAVDVKRVTKLIDKEIANLERDTAKYIAALKQLRSRMIADLIVNTIKESK
jgi:hypothetical protein